MPQHRRRDKPESVDTPPPARTRQHEGVTMAFRLDDTQREIATLAANVLRREPDQPWKALGQAGLLNLARPERLGGDGLGVIETCVVLSEVGRAAVATPALATL